MSIRSGQLLYHLTELENMDTIIQCGLLSRNEMIKNGFSFIDVADQEIIKFRQESGLNEYVPFHFYVNNPFDGRVQRDNKEKNFAYLCVRREFAKGNGFKIIPRHPKSMVIFEMFDYEEGIEKIEWDVMDNKNERDHGDNNIRNICMAEAVVKKSVDLKNIYSINVACEEDKQYVENLMRKYKVINKPYINITCGWFVY